MTIQFSHLRQSEVEAAVCIHELVDWYRGFRHVASKQCLTVDTTRGSASSRWVSDSIMAQAACDVFASLEITDRVAQHILDVARHT